MSICSISDCNKQVFSGGWCCGHYERWKKYGNPQFIPDSRRKKPLEGKTFGKWTVISLASNEKVGHRVMYRWLCKCQCGEEREIAEQGLLNGRTASCGCSRQDVLAIDLTGQRFGRWVVLRRVKLKLRASKRGSKWECRCDCGTERAVSANALKHSGSTSCGCAQREYAAALAPRTRSVGKGKAAQRSMWSGYKKGALKRGYDFALTYEEFCELTEMACHYCGDAVGYVYSARYASGQFQGNGVDRYNNSKGYTKENCVPCCKRCNFTKRELHGDEFIAMCKLIASIHS